MNFINWLLYESPQLPTAIPLSHAPDLNTQPTSKNVTRRPGAAFRGEEPGEKSLARKGGVVVWLLGFNKSFGRTHPWVDSHGTCPHGVLVLNHIPFFSWVICRFQPLILRGVLFFVSSFCCFFPLGILFYKKQIARLATAKPELPFGKLITAM